MRGGVRRGEVGRGVAGRGGVACGGVGREVEAAPNDAVKRA